MKSTVYCLLGLVAVAAMASPAGAAPLDSSSFTYQYNGEDPVTGYVAHGPFDVAPSSTGGILSYRSTAGSGAGYFENSIWEGVVTPATGWTIEFRVKIGTDVAEGSEGAFAFAVTDGNGIDLYRMFYVGQGSFGTRYESPYILSDNTDDFHTFRVAKAGGSNAFQAWRDGVLVGSGTGFSDVANFFQYWGDGGGNIGGPTVELDYVRFTLGAFEPVPEPATFALLGLGAVGAVWLTRRRPVR